MKKKSDIFISLQVWIQQTEKRTKNLHFKDSFGFNKKIFLISQMNDILEITNISELKYNPFLFKGLDEIYDFILHNNSDTCDLV